MKIFIDFFLQSNAFEDYRDIGGGSGYNFPRVTTSVAGPQ
jgi:hypothetical protein